MQVKVSKKVGNRVFESFVTFEVTEEKAKQMEAYHTGRGARAKETEGGLVLDYFTPLEERHKRAQSFKRQLNKLSPEAKLDVLRSATKKRGFEEATK